jgi:hypothetical protein
MLPGYLRPLRIYLFLQSVVLNGRAEKSHQIWHTIRPVLMVPELKTSAEVRGKVN